MKIHAVIVLILLLLVGSVSATDATFAMPEGKSLYPPDWVYNAQINDTVMFPPHANNADYMANIKSQNGGVDPYLYTYPAFTLNVINNSTVTPAPQYVTFTNPTYSDNVKYPIPANVVYENSSPDHHMSLYDPDLNILWELYLIHYNPTYSNWTASVGNMWNLSDYTARPMGWTSVNAAGLPEYVGVIRKDEIDEGLGTGEINHAIGMTFGNSMNNQQVFPATHTSAKTGGVIPAGTRIRMKESCDVSGYSPEKQVIFRAMKKYGMILMDSSGTNSIVAMTAAPDIPSAASFGYTAPFSVNTSCFEFINQTKYITSWGTTNGVRYSWKVSVAPVASFTKNRIIVMRPGVIVANSSCTNSPTTYQWNFGDGTSTVATANATHVYTRPGIFTIGLTCGNVQGNGYTTDWVLSLVGWGT